MEGKTGFVSPSGWSAGTRARGRGAKCERPNMSGFIFFAAMGELERRPSTEATPAGSSKPPMGSDAAGGSVAPAETQPMPSLAKLVESGLSFTDVVGKLVRDGVLPQRYAAVVMEWYHSYLEAAKKSDFIAKDPRADPRAVTDRNFAILLELCNKQIASPYQFELFHESIKAPFDYYQFGLDFADPVIDYTSSKVRGLDALKSMEAILARGENVVILSNHQSEGEPQAIDAVLRRVCDSDMGEKFIFMAGDRVREDLLAVPFTLGRNIVTVYSKKHMDDVPELKADKMTHNKRTMQEITGLFRKGGKLLWIAPSGGRDRRSKETGKVELSKFDPEAIETIRFVAARAGVPTHFFPMALSTYTLLPPPETVETDMGEKRVVNHVPANFWFGSELNMDVLARPGDDKQAQRAQRAEAIFEWVKTGYTVIGGYDQ